MKRLATLALVASLAALCHASQAANGQGKPSPNAGPGHLTSDSALQAQVPDVFRMPPEEGFVGPSTWVSAKAAADADHVVKWNLFGDTSEDSSLHAAIREQDQAAAAPKGGGADVVVVPESHCPSITISSVFSENPDRPAETLDDLIANSIGVYAGAITAITPGLPREVGPLAAQSPATVALQATSTGILKTAGAR